MIFNEYADREMLAMTLADRLASALRKCLTVHEVASFAVPGGTSPGPIFDLMSGAELAWDRVHVMLTDERWVPETDPRSNGALVRERLITGPAAGARFLPFYRDGLTAMEGSDMVSDTLSAEMPLSVLLLGMGADMHTASLFPGAEGLTEALAGDAPLLCPIAPEGEVARVTLPAHALKGAMETHVVIFGDEKRAALEKAESLPPEDAPISTVLGTATVHWAA